MYASTAALGSKATLQRDDILIVLLIVKVGGFHNPQHVRLFSLCCERL